MRRGWTPLEMLQNTAIGLTQTQWKKEMRMNQTLAFEQAKAQLKELKRRADAGDEDAKKLLDAYDRCSPAVLGIPLPKLPCHISLPKPGSTTTGT